MIASFLTISVAPKSPQPCLSGSGFPQRGTQAAVVGPAVASSAPTALLKVVGGAVRTPSAMVGTMAEGVAALGKTLGCSSNQEGDEDCAVDN